MNVWEIWFADFPYEEDNTITKQRSVIVLSVEPLRVLSVKVTSQNVRAEDKYDTPIVYWQFAGLKKPFVARVSKTMFLDKQKIMIKIGTLHDDDKISILSKYKEYISENTTI